MRPGSLRTHVTKAGILFSFGLLGCGSEAAGGTSGSTAGNAAVAGATQGLGGGSSGLAGSETSGGMGQSGTHAGGGGIGGSLATAGAGGASSMGGGGGGNGAGGSSAGSSGSVGGGGGPGGLDPAWCKIGPVPAALRQSWDIDPYYTQYADANGIPILTSDAPPDKAIDLACRLVIEMVSERDDVRKALIENKTHFTVIGKNEKTNDVPEYAYLDDSINTRARGLGGNPGMCAEESILCGNDPWRGESICVHEFAHTISLYGMYDADPTFEDRLIKAYEAAKKAGRFANTYAMENEQEYWGEVVQDWYYTNLESDPPNGVHGPIDTREELKAYDPTAYALVDELLSDKVSWQDCYRDD